ncbi:MAG: 3-methyl-2-oxobutanoate hydroxymethyltransferase [Acidobacteriota bacterium]
MNSITDLQRAKRQGRVISMVTCYDHWTARIVQRSEVDCILIGDSAAMVAHGFDDTISATPEMMAWHVRAVAKGAPDKLIVGDFPFLAHRKGEAAAFETADLLMKAGAQAVKIEGLRGHQEILRALVESGVPVMGHLGLTPQSLHAFGGFRVQAKQRQAADQLVRDALELQTLGCFSVVLEAIPNDVARRVTEALDIPTIGIGAGPDTSGQVLVLQDLLGMNPDFEPRFVRRYLDGSNLFREALDRFACDVRQGEFPAEKETYGCSKSSTA